MKKINSGKGKNSNNKSATEYNKEIEDTQNFNNYDSHSEEQPVQTEIVDRNAETDRSSGANKDTKIKIGK